MVKREIILADTDNEIRGEMADIFRRNGYQVETTDSATHVVCTVLEKRVPVVLLGGDFDKKIALNEMVRLLKNCNRHLTIILVSNEESLPRIRSVRQQGIFYHALKPNNREQVEEICQAIECAFNKHDQSASRYDVTAIREEQSAVKDDAAAISIAQAASRDDVTAISVAQAAFTDGVSAISEEKPRHDKEKPMKAKTRVIGAAGTILGIAAIATAVPSLSRDSSELAMWGFLGCCALIIVGQLIPAFFVFKTARDVAAQHVRDAAAAKQEAPAVRKD
jgi:FixJ family two-component response regulator